MKLNTIQLCSRCTIHEIASWVFDNQLKLEPDVIRQIRDETKDIKLKEGECIVCSSNRVSEGCFEKILQILEKNNSDATVVLDFKKFCGLSPENFLQVS